MSAVVYVPSYRIQAQTRHTQAEKVNTCDRPMVLSAAMRGPKAKSRRVWDVQARCMMWWLMFGALVAGSRLLRPDPAMIVGGLMGPGDGVAFTAIKKGVGGSTQIGPNRAVQARGLFKAGSALAGRFGDECDARRLERLLDDPKQRLCGAGELVAGALNPFDDGEPDRGSLGQLLLAHAQEGRARPDLER